MQFAKGAEHRRPEPQRAGPARVVPGGRVGGDLDVLRRRAHRGESGERIGLDVVKIDLAGRLRQCFGPVRPLRTPAAASTWPSGVSSR